MAELVKALSAPSGIFGLSVFWAWAIPLALVAANVAMILLIRRDYRRHDAQVAALYARQAAFAVDCTADTRRAVFMGAEAGARAFGGNPYVNAPSAPSREAYEAFLAACAPPADDASFLRSLGIAPEEP